VSKPKPYAINSVLSTKYNRPDPVLKSWFVKKVIGGMPLKSRARNRALVYSVFRSVRVKGRLARPALALGYIFHKLMPLFWVRVYKMGKRVKAIPYRMSPHKGYKHSVRWFLRAFRARRGPTLHKRLESEFIAAVSGESIVYK